MKYFILLFLILCAGCGQIIDTKKSIQSIDSPHEITFIDRGVYDVHNDTLFIAVKQDDGTCGVWKYNETFEQVLNIEESTCFGVHIFLINDVIYVSSNAPAQLRRSEDGGMTWNIVLEKVDMFWSMGVDVSSVYGTLWSHDFPAIYRSDDDGMTWYEWINFHDVFVSSTESYDESGLSQMRHLHDIIVSDEYIMVGTGDVMRRALLSSDDGQTWSDVWDEGFTTHIYDGDQIILGADKMNNKGIAVFDKKTQKTKDVWVPQNGWQGYTYSMLKKDNIYYTAFHVENNIARKDISYGILRSKDGIDWEVWYEYMSQDESTQLYILDGPDNTIYQIHNGILSQIAIP